MPLWPFGRKKRRTSDISQAAAFDVGSEKPGSGVSDPRRDMTISTQTPARPRSREGSHQRKRKATGGADDAAAAETLHKQPVEHPLRNTSVQDITALPGVRELESSPHLRPVSTRKPIIPYNLDPGSPARVVVSRGATAHSTQESHTGLGQSTRNTTPQRKRSNRPKEQELREEHIRAMSAPMQIPKRPAGVNNDLLRRDSKKARRTLSKQRPEDPRGSNVSLPMSVPSTMSGKSEQRGWLVGGIDVLSPRPTVRLSVPGYYPTKSATLPRPSKKERLPTIARESSKNNRRKIDDLADELDSSDLRAVLERDARRKEKKATEQQDRLERRLRRRAERQRAEEEGEQGREREGEMDSDPAPAAIPRSPPTATHPAFREQGQEEEADVMTGVLTSETSNLEDKMDSEETKRSPSGGEPYAHHPVQHDSPQNQVDHPEHRSNQNPEPLSAASDAKTDHWSPVQTPIDEPVLETARAVRLSAGPMSPPTSPRMNPQAAESSSELSDLQAQRTSSVPQLSTPPQPRQQSENSPRRTGTWASIFRRGTSFRRSNHVEQTGPAASSEGSFANVSRDSVSRQAVPAHLVQQPSRRSGAPVRTQSKFREDLPDAPMSPPDSRVQSPELSIAAANAAAARRAKHAVQQTEPASDSEAANIGRTDSPVIPEDAELPVSQSLASIDSEGSWISGRPQRRSTRRLQRDSAASTSSPSKHADDFTGSYERLPIPEHEYFNSLTPSGGSRRASSEAAPPSTRLDATPTTTTSAADPESNTPLRHGTIHRRPTVIHNEPRRKSREGLIAEFITGSRASRSRASSLSGRESPETSPVEQPTVQRATSVSYRHSQGHAKTVSAGSAKLLNITPSRSGSRRTSPASGSPALQ